MILSTKLKFIASALVAAFTLQTHADTYPNKPINLIVPFAPGGVTDVMARIVATKLQEDLGSPVVVMNKPGAGKALASAYVARMPPDGYNILMAASSSLWGRVCTRSGRATIPIGTLSRYR